MIKLNIDWATVYTYATAPIRLVVIVLFLPFIVYGLYTYYRDKKK
jgi:hypothetical protein